MQTQMDQSRTIPMIGRFVVAMAVLWGPYAAWPPHAAASRIEKRHIASIRGFEDAAISPKGDKVAVYVVDPTYRDPSGALVESRLEIRDVASLKIDSIVNLPDSVLFSALFQWSKPMPKVLYCDDSKYLFVYLGDGASVVIETATGLTHTIAPIKWQTPRYQTRLAASCAAHADVLAFVVHSDRDAVNRVELFDLKDGKEAKEFSGGISRGDYVGLDVSPSGDHVLTYMACEEDTVCVKLSTAIQILDTRSGTVLKAIDTGFPIGHASFAGDSSIAAVSGDPKKPEVRRVEIYSVQTGALTSEVGNRHDSPVAFIAASAAGTLLLAYTGSENRCADCNQDSRGYLQITHAQFTVWYLTTGRLIARSPGISPRKIRGGILEDGQNLRTNERPRFQLSGSGNAVLVTNTRDLSAVDVFLLPDPRAQQ